MGMMTRLLNTHKTKILLFILLGCLPMLNISAQNTLWSASMGSRGHDTSGAIDVDAQGNAYVVHNYREDLYLPNGDTLPNEGEIDMALVKWSPDGDVVWARHFGEANADRSADLAVDADGNVYLVGTFTGTLEFSENISISAERVDDIFIAKFNSLGSAEWAIAAGGDWNDQAKGLCLGDDALYVVGRFASSDAFLGVSPMIAVGGWDAYVAKLGLDGTPEWVKTFGGQGDEVFHEVAVDSNDQLYAVGELNGSLQLGDDTLRADVSPSFTVQFSRLGIPQWTRQQTSEQAYTHHSTIIDSAGAVYSAGYFEGNLVINNQSFDSEGGRDMLLIKHDVNGKLQWVFTQGGATDDAITTMQLSQKGHLLIGGYFHGNLELNDSVQLSATGGSDNIVFQLDTSGQYMWHAVSGGLKDDTLYDLATKEDGAFVATGTYEEQASFKADETSEGESDVFIWKFDDEPSGVLTLPFNESWKLYPNPADNAVVLQNKSGTALREINLYSTRGHLVKKIYAGTKQADRTTRRINTAQLPTGLYILTITDTHGNRFQQKLVVK